VTSATRQGQTPATQKVTRLGGGRGFGPSPRLRRRGRRAETISAGILTAPYIVLLLIAGVIPTVYAVVQSLKGENGGFGGLQSYKTVTSDFRFVSTFEHIGVVLLVWLPIMMIGVTAMALLVHWTPGRYGSFSRFIYYLPGAAAGIANFMLWLYLLNPGQSPYDFLWRGFGYSTIDQVASPGHLPIILAAMLFFQGAGTWMVILNGGLNGIPDEVIEAASIDGSSAWQTAWRIQLPIIRPWLGYMALLNVAYGFQLFLEPQVMSQVTHGLISPQYTPNQLSYTYAYQILDTPAAAAMSVLLVLITLALGLIIVFRSGIFDDGQ
jgi:multiple sugar transport system permease protein